MTTLQPSLVTSQRPTKGERTLNIGSVQKKEPAAAFSTPTTVNASFEVMLLLHLPPCPGKVANIYHPSPNQRRRDGLTAIRAGTRRRSP